MFLNIQAYGQFTKSHYTPSIDKNPSHCVVIDLDNDGDMDFLTDENKIMYYNNVNGLGTFDYIELISNLSGDMAVDDIDGDNDDDIFIFDKHKIYWLENLNTSPVSFTEHSINSINDDNYLKYVYAVDVDKDGDKDLVKNSISWIRNDMGTFSNEIIIDTSKNIKESILAMDFYDLNGDTYLDLFGYKFLDNDFAQIVYFPSNESIILYGEFSLLIDSFPSFIRPIIKVLDFDKDGNVDIIIHHSEDQIGWFQGEGNMEFKDFQHIHQYFDIPSNMEVVDFDKDGYYELLWSGHGGLFWEAYKDNNDFAKEAYRIGPDNPNKAVRDVCIADFDGDDDLDILALGTSINGYDNATRWYENELEIINSVNKSNDHPIKIYPNPSDDILFLEVDDLQVAVILDMQGRIVTKSNEKSINTSSLPSGEYLLKVHLSTVKVITKKINIY